MTRKINLFPFTRYWQDSITKVNNPLTPFVKEEIKSSVLFVQGWGITINLTNKLLSYFLTAMLHYV
ncbi:MAG: hypothetical protein SCABRO_02594 [Candidatus Scalindua brodae]|uniref:Uncharacterized protein n=1 Tax=Candidatus Scalindua brodae TaxID=237368 RepID=A0A0B0EHY9_9BACT|nr:MAG: hypothetical protein SCABRO_02594 [Candidatus Scalindua brodae]